MKSNMTSTKIKKKLSEFIYNYITIKEDEPEKIDIKSNELFENETRNNMVKWLSFLCETLNFSNQTLYRSVTIFDKFISVSDLLENNDLNQEKMNLITIGCLSLATKLEEINCNYVKFFTDKVLNLPDCQIFSIKDLTKMEMEILKKLNYKTLYSSSYDFLLFYLDLIEYLFHFPKIFIENIKIFALDLMKQNINTNIFLSLTQSDYAFICLQQTLIQMGQSDIITKIRNFFNNDNLERIKREDNNNKERDFVKRNLEINYFSLSSF